VAASWDGVEFWLEFSVPTGVGVSEEATVCENPENKKTVKKIINFHMNENVELSHSHKLTRSGHC
jgi:hypothetical protein